MPSGASILFATGNKHKFTEAQAILSQFQITIEQYPHRPPELQSDSVEQIAQHGCELLFEQVQSPIFVEDAGLFINRLNGFPGPYSAFALRTIGNSGILKLMKGIGDRTAIFRSAVAYVAPNQPCIVLVGETPGHISRTIRGTHWGFDPVFCPTEGSGRTYAEMKVEEKNQVSHRARALVKLADHLLGRKIPE